MTVSPFCADMTDGFSASTQLVIYLNVSLPQSQFLILASLVAEVIRQAPRNIFRLFKAGHLFPLTGGAWSPSYECRAARQRFCCWYFISSHQARGNPPSITMQRRGGQKTSGWK